MLDKLEERLSPFTVWRPQIAEVAEAALRGTNVPGLESRGGYYAARVNLSPYGTPVKLSLGQKSNGSHKIEHLECGRKPMRELIAETEAVTMGDPLEHEAMRCDLAADCPEIGVQFFCDHARLKFKRHVYQFGKYVLEFSAMGRREIETYYLGARPNPVRIYNKTHERLQKYNAMLRKLRQQNPEIKGQKWAQFMAWLDKDANACLWIDGILFSVTSADGFYTSTQDGFTKDDEGEFLVNDTRRPARNQTYKSDVKWTDEMCNELKPPPKFKLKASKEIPMPSFESIYGHAPDAVITRVERQISAGRIDQVRQEGAKQPYFVNADGKVTLTELTRKLADFNPFEQMEITGSAGLAKTANRENFTSMEYLKLRGLLAMLKDEPKQDVMKYLNRDGNSGSRTFERFEEYIPRAEGGGELERFMTEQHLRETYRDSMKKQLEGNL